MADLVMDRQMIGKPKEKYWITYIKKRLSPERKKNFLGFVSGQTGSGKSWASISIAQDIDPNFNIDQIVFRGIDLMALINSKKLKRGSAIVFEEVGVELSNRNWMSDLNTLINHVIQTFRHEGYALIMNSPFMDYLDSASRKLFHAEITMESIDFNTQESITKPLLIQYNSKKQKFYFKRLKVITSEGIVPISRWRIHKPQPQELIDQYEAKKREYTSKLNKQVEGTLRANEKEKEEENKLKEPKELTEKQKEIFAMYEDGLKAEEIALELKKHPTVIYFHLSAIRKKGYDIDNKHKKVQMGD